MLSRQSLYVGMSRGRESNIGHVFRWLMQQLTLSPLDGARSLPGGLPGRRGTAARPDTPVSWTARTPQSAGEIAQATAEALFFFFTALGPPQLSPLPPRVILPI